MDFKIYYYGCHLVSEKNMNVFRFPEHIFPVKTTFIDLKSNNSQLSADTTVLKYIWLNNPIVLRNIALAISGLVDYISH